MQRNIGARSKTVTALKMRSDGFLDVDLITCLCHASHVRILHGNRGESS